MEQSQEVTQTETGFEHTETTGLDIASERREEGGIHADQEVELPKPAAEVEAENNFEVPEKFKDKSLEDVIKSYSELEKKIGEKRSANAPDNYEVSLSEELENAGFDVDLEDPLINKFADIARENGMSNDQFNELLNLYGESIMDGFKPSEEEVKAYRQAEMAKLGEDGPAIVEQLKTWGKNNLSESEYDLFMQFGDSAESLKFLQKLVNNSSSPSIAPSGSQLNYTRDDLKSMMADKRYGMDLGYTKKVDGLFKEVYATTMR